MKKAILALFALILILVSCNVSPNPVPEDKLPCYVSGYVPLPYKCGWKLYKSSEQEPETIRLVEDLTFKAETEKHSEYILKLYLFDGETNKVVDGKLISERTVHDVLLFTIDTHEFFRNEFSFHCVAGEISYYWNKF